MSSCQCSVFFSLYVVSIERLFSHVNAAFHLIVTLFLWNDCDRHVKVAVSFFIKRYFIGSIVSSRQYSVSFSVNVVSMEQLFRHVKIVFSLFTLV